MVIRNGDPMFEHEDADFGHSWCYPSHVLCMQLTNTHLNGADRRERMGNGLFMTPKWDFHGFPIFKHWDLNWQNLELVQKLGFDPRNGALICNKYAAILLVPFVVTTTWQILGLHFGSPQGIRIYYKYTYNYNINTYIYIYVICII